LESGVEFVAVDNPHANKLMVHILVAVAQHERELIAQRTPDALSGRQGARQEARQSEARSSPRRTRALRWELLRFGGWAISA
jgi:DNA invertase Pin-like site-specific DNA recombinase